jgi:hypothetical protein
MATSGALDKLYIPDQGFWGTPSNAPHIRPSPGQLWAEGNYEGQDPAGLVTKFGWLSG